MKLQKPNNQWAHAILLLIENHKQGVTMLHAMRDYFHKFQSRLGEIERTRKSKLKIIRVPVTRKNRFGHTCTYTKYKSAANINYLINLYNKINRNGTKMLS
jgi:hypothetical protein